MKLLAVILGIVSVVMWNVTIYLLTNPAISDRWGNLTLADALITTIAAVLIGIEAWASS